MMLVPFFDTKRESGDTGATGKVLLQSNTPPKKAPMIFWNGGISPGYPGGPNYSKMIPGTDPTGILTPTNPLTVLSTGNLYGNYGGAEGAYNPQTMSWYGRNALDSYYYNQDGSITFPWFDRSLPCHFSTGFMAYGSNPANWAWLLNTGPRTYLGATVMTRYRGTTDPDSDGYWLLSFAWCGYPSHTTTYTSCFSQWKKMQTDATDDSPVGSYAKYGNVGTVISDVSNVSVQYLT